MGLRFRQRIRIVPGFYLNIGKKGTSFSLGRPGATVNFGGKRGPRATLGLPGTGLSYTTALAKGSSAVGRGLRLLKYALVLLIILLVLNRWLFD